jgi:hypothetical protein
LERDVDLSQKKRVGEVPLQKIAKGAKQNSRERTIEVFVLVLCCLCVLLFLVQTLGSPRTRQETTLSTGSGGKRRRCVRYPPNRFVRIDRLELADRFQVSRRSLQTFCGTRFDDSDDLLTEDREAMISASIQNAFDLIDVLIQQ